MAVMLFKHLVHSSTHMSAGGSTQATKMLEQTESTEAKFHRLLRPYKELADDWNIDLEEELVDFIRDELNSVDQATAVNFAQAALLVQNSALVYTKKVEALYELINKSLEHLSLSLTSKPTREGVRKRNSAEAEDIDDEGDCDELDEDSDNFGVLPLRGSGSFEQAPVLKRSDLDHRTFLIPLVYFDIASSTEVGPNLLKTKLINIRTGAFADEQQAEELQAVSELDQPHPTEEVLNGAESTVIPDSGFGDDYDDGPEYGDDGADSLQQVPDTAVRTPKTKKTMSFNDFLDPDVPCTTRRSKAFVKGRCYIELSDDRLMDEDVSLSVTKIHDYCSQAPLLTILLDNQQVRTSSKVGLFGLAFREFEPLYKLITQKRRVRARKHGEGPSDTDEALYDDAGGFDADDFDAGDYGTAEFGAPGLPMPSNDQLQISEAAVNESPETYADLVREHVARFVETAKNWASETKLSLMVRGWHDHLEPILEEEEQRPPFDLRDYEAVIVNELKQIESSAADENPIISFETLVKESEQFFRQRDEEVMRQKPQPIPRWDVCRIFLTALELANQGSIQIDESQGRLADSEIEFVRRREDCLKLVYVKPQRNVFTKVGGGKKKAIRISKVAADEGKENA